MAKVPRLSLVDQTARRSLRIWRRNSLNCPLGGASPVQGVFIEAVSRDRDARAVAPPPYRITGFGVSIRGQGGFNDRAFPYLPSSGAPFQRASHSDSTSLGCAPVYADGIPVRVRGTVVSRDGSKLVVRAKDGKDVSVSLADKFAALAVVKSSMADIKEGTFIGTATVTQPDTTLRSVEVVVFPDSLRGTAEGHYPWDLGSSSMMTNATVANAVKAVDGQTVTVTYKGGEKKINIPADVPVVALVPASNDDIAVGAIVFVPTERQSDGSLHSGAVLFGEDGVIPPM
jgi:hypothetical protein